MKNKFEKSDKRTPQKSEHATDKKTDATPKKEDDKDERLPIDTQKVDTQKECDDDVGESGA